MSDQKKKKNEKRTCNYEMHDRKPCGRPMYKYDDEHCIFHSKEIKEKRNAFNSTLSRFLHFSFYIRINSRKSLPMALF